MTNTDTLDIMMGNYSLRAVKDLPGNQPVAGMGLVEHMLRNSQVDKVASIRENITDMENMILHREELSKKTIVAIDAVIDSVEKILLEVYGYSTGNSNIEQTDLKKEMLKKKFDMVQAKVNEGVNVWQDVAALRKEMREHFKELRDIESKSGMLENLMSM